MTLILSSTIGAGILVSKLFLYYKMPSPILRYTISVSISYFIFFLLMKLWIRLHFERITEVSHKDNSTSQLASDTLENTIDLKDLSIPTDSSVEWKGSGGGFSGGGASGSWDEALPQETAESSASSSVDVGDADEFAVIFLFVLLIAAICGSTFYLIYQAPEIMLEAGFEVILASTLARKAKVPSANVWLWTLFKKTWIAFVVILIISALFGSFIKSNCPEAISFHQYLQMCSKK